MLNAHAKIALEKAVNEQGCSLMVAIELWNKAIELASKECDKYTTSAELCLHAGEMEPQEKRTALAIAQACKRSINNLSY